MAQNIKVSALLDGGFKPPAIRAHYGYSPDLIRKIQRLKKEGKSLAPNFVGGVPMEASKKASKWRQRNGIAD